MNKLDYQPLPLINPTRLKNKSRQHGKSSSRSDFQTGLLVLITTWTAFITATLLIFEIITIPNCLFWCNDVNDETDDFPVDNYYSYAILLVPVMAWIWVVVSWTGLKLFKHARGGKIKNSTGSMTRRTS